MDLNRLFLRRCDQVAELMASADEGDLVDLAGRLRQLLFDGNASLVDKINPNKIPLQFVVGTFRFPPEPNSTLSLQDGFDPETASPGKPSRTVSREEFSTYPVIYLGLQPITVREVVRYAALVAGGVHHDDKPRDEFKQIVDAAKRLHIGGLPFGIRDLMAIARVTIKGLQPLIEDVRRKA
jgi:hypothetical protein